jgi:hypothetical protein
MKKVVLGSAVAVTLCMAAPFAQELPVPTATTTPQDGVVLLTGCVTASAEEKPVYKLSDPSSTGQPTAGRAAGASGAAGQPTSVELRPVSGENAKGLGADALMAHVGQRVEVIVRKVDPSTAAPATQPVAGETAKPGEPAPEPFSVIEIKPVSGSCPK